MKLRNIMLGLGLVGIFFGIGASPINIYTKILVISIIAFLLGIVLTILDAWGVKWKEIRSVKFVKGKAR